VAAERHADTHAASSAHTMSTTDTAIAHGIDIPASCPSRRRSPALRRSGSATSLVSPWQTAARRPLAYVAQEAIDTFRFRAWTSKW
jgi:hypothetical protein